MAFTLKQARLIAGLSQKDMASKLNIDRGTYIKLEKNPNGVTVKQAKEIAVITGISYDNIFFTD